VQLQAFIQQQTERFEALNSREKTLIALAILSMLYGIYTVLIEPVIKQSSKTNTQIQNHVAEKHSLELQLNALTQKKQHRTQTPEQLRVAQLDNNISALAVKIDRLKASLISPEKVPDLLKDLLAKNQNLQLVELSTLPPTGLFNDENNESHHEHALPVFKHGVEMKVKGHYLDLVQYVENIENLPWHILWESANVAVEDSPKTAFPLSELTLTVYSLSLDKEWLSI